MSLEVTHVDKWFDTRGKKGSAQHVLRDVAITIETGEFVSLIGHSGCGKSTLLNVVAGLVVADSGAVTLDGVPVTEPGPDRAIVFQNYSLLPRMSLFDNVRVAVRSARRDKSREWVDEHAERYLRAVDLWPHKEKRPSEVSGGMQQRAAVARAFAVEPRILLLDEPFGALDALTRARLQLQLVELWQSESRTETVLMVTHGIEEAIFLADRIIVMSGPPGPSVLDDIRVPLARPRDRATMIDDPAYHQVYDRLVTLLTEQSVDAA